MEKEIGGAKFVTKKRVRKNGDSKKRGRQQKGKMEKNKKKGKNEKIKQDDNAKKWKIYHKQKRVVKRTLNETRECEFPKETHMLIRKTLKGFTR